jgi:hypothetical protein
MTDTRLYKLAYYQLFENFVEVCECVLSHPNDEVKQCEKDILWSELVQLKKEMRDINID